MGRLPPLHRPRIDGRGCCRLPAGKRTTKTVQSSDVISFPRFASAATRHLDLLGARPCFLYCQLDFAQAKTIVFRFPFDRLPRRFDHVRFDRDVRVLSALSGLSFYFLFSFFSRFVIV